MAPGAKSVMMLHDANTRSISQSMTGRWEDDFTTSYTDYYVRLNKWTEEFAHFDVGQATVVDDIVPREVTLKSEFYADWLRPQNLMTGVTISVFKENLRYMNFSVLYDDTGEEQQRQNAAFLQALSPHLRRAGQINRQMSGLAFVSQALVEAFDRVNRGVALVHADGRSFYCNDQAKQYFDLRDGLVLYPDGRIGCQDQDVESDLYRTIRAAGKTAKGTGNSPGGITTVPRHLAARPWSVMIAPIPASAADFGHTEGAVALFIVDPNRAPTISAANLRAVLGITEAEARVAISLAEGKSPEEIAQEQGKAILTVRTHLRNAMSKTGVGRLAELVALVLRSDPSGRSW